MYRKYYGLKADPFRLSPDHAFCLPHRSFAKAKAYMRYAMHRGEGFVMITGAPGTGKTTLIDDLLAGTRDLGFSVARLVSAQVEADDILRMVAAEFGLSVGHTSKSEILRLLSELFTRNYKQGKRSLLIVDEAQGLGLTALEELRLLTNMRIGGQPTLQIFLVGQEELRDMVTSPELEQLNQRMIAAYHMEPLKPDEFVAYVLHRLSVAGWKGNPRFMPELFPELFRFSNGLPRRINHICSRLLLHGFLEEKSQLDAADMEIVIKELRAEHYAIKENASLITPDKFNPEDLQRMAQTAMSEKSAALTQQVKKPEHNAATVAAPRPGEKPAAVQQPLHRPVQPVAALVMSADPRRAVKASVQAGAKQAVSASLRNEPIDIDREIRASERRVFFRLPFMRVHKWTVAASTLTVGLSLLLVSVPSQQLNRFGSQSLWNSIGLTDIRTQVSDWSGGRLPLKGANDTNLRSPISPAAIERSEEQSVRTLGRVKTAARLNEAGSRVAQMKEESLESAPVLSESGARLFN